MPNLMIRDVSEELKAALAAEAERSNRSLNAQLLSILEAHVDELRRRARMAEASVRLDEFRETLRRKYGTLSDSVHDIRDDRESR